MFVFCACYAFVCQCQDLGQGSCAAEVGMICNNASKMFSERSFYEIGKKNVFAKFLRSSFVWQLAAVRVT